MRQPKMAKMRTELLKNAKSYLGDGQIMSAGVIQAGSVAMRFVMIATCLPQIKTSTVKRGLFNNANVSTVVQETIHIHLFPIC